MATLGKMRNHGVFLIVVVGLALLAFIVGDFLNSSASIFNEARSNVAKIDGEKISASEYMAAIDQLADVYKIEYGMNNLTDEMNEQIRQAVWETMIRERVLTAETEKIGMTISKKELSDMIVGSNIHPLIANRRAFFNPQTNEFDPVLLAQFVSMIDSEDAVQMPSEQLRMYRQYWRFWESTVKNARLEDKYSALLSRSIVANALEAKNAFEGGKTQVSVAYAMKPYFAVADSLVNVSDGDIKKLYKQKREQFAQEASRDLKYVSFAIVPSAEDYAEAQAWIDGLKGEFATTNDVADLTNSNSDMPYKAHNLAKNDVDADFAEFAFAGKKGDVTDVIFADDTYKMARIVETGINHPDSVKLRFVDISESTLAQAQYVADSLEKVLRSADGFASIQQNYRAGEAWVREVDIDHDIAEKAFTVAANEVFQQKNMSSVRLFQVVERGAVVPKVKLAVLGRKVIPSSPTRARIFNAAKQFAASCSNLETLESNAADQNLEVLSANRLNINSAKIQNVKNSRQIVRWAFEANEGEVSDVFECDGQQIVAAVSRSAEKGYAPIDEVKIRLVSEIRNEKKAELLKKEFAGKSIAELESAGVTVDSVAGVNFNMPYAGGIGNEPVLFALAPKANVGELSQPQQGNVGVFVFSVLDKSESPAEFDEKAECVLLTERMRNSVSYLSFEALRKAADVQDERYKFF